MYCILKTNLNILSFILSATETMVSFKGGISMVQFAFQNGLSSPELTHHLVL